MGNKLTAISGWLGLFLFLGGLLALGINPGWQLYITIAEGFALLFFLFFFITHFEAVKGFSTKRSTKFGFNSFLMVFMFLSIIGILNFLSSRHNHRVDLSETNRFSLAPQTKKILKNLEKELKITAFTQTNTPSELQIKDLLKNYSYASQNISIQFIDPSKKPAIAKQYGITQYDTIVLESGPQETQINNATEQELTNAIIRVNKKEKQLVLFLEGHGEHALSDTGRQGFSRVKDALEKQAYEIESLSLLQTGKVPDKTALLVIAGPQRAVLPQEIQALDQYLEENGKILAMIDPQVETQLEGFLEKWGIQMGPGIVVDTLSRLFGGDLTIPIVTNYPPHKITEGFGLATFFPLAQRIYFDSPNPDLQFQPLAETTENSWSKVDLSDGDVSFDAEQDIRGPLTLAGIVTKESKEGLEEDAMNSQKDQAILVIFGDSDFATNDSFNFSGNGDLFLNTINFLAKEKDLIGITPKEANFSPLFLSRLQGKIILYTSIFLIPGFVFFTGLIIWKRRRRL